LAVDLEEFVSQRWTQKADCGLKQTSEPFFDPWDAAEKRRLRRM
jgi:hypothetical protein